MSELLHPPITERTLYERDLAMLPDGELRLRYEHLRWSHQELIDVAGRVMLDAAPGSCDYQYAANLRAELVDDLASFTREMLRRTEARRRAVGDPKVPVWPRVDTDIRDRVAAAKAAVSPLDVVERYLGCVVERSGNHYKTSCPMPSHGGDDSDPSFHIYEHGGICYGCGWRGDQIDMILRGDQRPGMTFLAALDVLESLAGLRKGGAR